MNARSVSDALDRLAPPQPFAGDWADVLTRAGLDAVAPSPPAWRNRRWVLAAAIVGVIVVAVTAAFTFGLPILDFGKAQKAPPESRVVKNFAVLDQGAPPGMATDVIPNETRKVATFGNATLWVAPTKQGGFCTDLGGEGGWDYVSIDTARHRVFIGRDNRVMVVDEATGKLISEIGGKLNRVHGVAFSYGTGHGFITSGGDSTVTMFDLATLAVLGTTTAADDADAILFDKATGNVFTMKWRREFLHLHSGSEVRHSGIRPAPASGHARDVRDAGARALASTSALARNGPQVVRSLLMLFMRPNPGFWIPGRPASRAGRRGRPAAPGIRPRGTRAVRARRLRDAAVRGPAAPRGGSCPRSSSAARRTRCA